MDNHVTVAQLEYLFSYNPIHDFRLQAEYRHNSLEGFEFITPGSRIFYNLYAASGMWNWRIRPDITWTNALRVDHLNLNRTGPIEPNDIITSNDDFNRTITEFSYNSGLVWHASDISTVRLSTARGVQAPSLWEMGHTIVFPPVIVMGNPQTSPSIITNYEIGYDRVIAPLNGALRLSVFHQRTQDLKAIDNVNVIGLTTQSGNIGDSWTTGAEVGLTGQIGDHWNWNTNYTIQQIKDNVTVNQGGTIETSFNAEDATPTHSINAHLGYTNGPWQIDGVAHYVSGYDVLVGPTPYSTVSSGNFLSLSGRVGYDITENITLALRGQEMNRSGVREASGSKKEREFFLSVSSRF